jgi:hypothetical protein
MKEASVEFAETLMEGIRLSDNPRYDVTTFNLATILYDTRAQVRALQDMIAEMDDIAISAQSFKIKCRSCEQYYDIPCNLSEMNMDMSYCGGSPRCCP